MIPATARCPRKILLAATLVGAALLGALGCGSAGARSAELTVSAAASVTDAAEDLAAAFREHSGATVTFNFGSSGQLAQQIAAGAPVDLFLSANEGYVKELVDGSLVDAADMAPYAQGTLAVWTPEDRSPVERLADLTSPDITRIAIANPETAPYGKAAKQALEAANVYTAVASKLIFGESVEQAMQYVESGNTDVGLVALSLTLEAGGTATPVPQELYDPVVQYLGVVKSTSLPEQARAFSEFVRGPEGVAILQRHGFSGPSS